jgi:mannose-1-phosphate guanylyltransferase
MAGGGGTRLWPQSRINRPKPFVDLFDEDTLIQKAYQRIRPLVPPEHIYIVAGERYANLIRTQLPELPPENFIAEPEGRNTAPAIGLGAIHIQKHAPQGVMAVLTADHLVRKEARFREAIRAAGEVAETGALVTLGIKTTGPATGFGHIEQGEPLGQFNGFEAYRAVRFTEKPDLETAVAFFASQRYHWNSGMFIWRIDRIMAEFARQMPGLHEALSTISAAIGTPHKQKTLEQVWHKVDRISIDYGVMEGAENVAVLPVDIDWSDVGSWSALYDESASAVGDNVVQAGELIDIDTEGCLVQSHKLVATVGLRDLVIVDTGDVLLVCRRDRTQDVRKLVDQLRVEGRDKYL